MSKYFFLLPREKDDPRVIEPIILEDTHADEYLRVRANKKEDRLSNISPLLFEEEPYNKAHKDNNGEWEVMDLVKTGHCNFLEEACYIFELFFVIYKSFLLK